MLLTFPSPAGMTPAESLPTGGTAALDVGGTAGWAYAPDWMSLPACGQWELPHIGGRGAKGCAFENKLIDFFEDFQPSVVVLASPLPIPALNNFSSAYQQFGLSWAVHVEAYRGSCAIVEIDEPSARRAVMGIGRFSRDTVKREVVDYCRRRGILVRSHHAADACILWLWRRMQMRGQRPIPGPLFQEAAE